MVSLWRSSVTSTAEGDMHDAMTAASVWSLPVIFIVQTMKLRFPQPEEGRGIQSFEQYAKSFGVTFLTVMDETSGMCTRRHSDAQSS